MDRLRFEFAVKADDPKTNIICVTSITTSKNQTFIIPERFQPARMHEEIIKTQAYQKVKTTLQRRHEKRQVWISMTEELKEAYMDEDENVQFKGYFLEEQIQQQASIAGVSEQALTRILENFAEKKNDTPVYQNVRRLSSEFVIEKFTGKTSNVSQWMNTFEDECKRLGIEEDIKKIEVLKAFLEDPSLDWYNSMLIKHGINSKWPTWKEDFCETYANKGWTPIRYAMSFRYIQGSLLEYALKKERLLLEINSFIDKPTLIDLIATGLPNFVSDRIDRDCLAGTSDLFREIRGLEHLVNKKNSEKRIVAAFERKIGEKVGKDKPCRICEKKNKGIRYHPESLCWFKEKINDRPKVDHMKNVNSCELELDFNEMDPKN